MPTCPGITCENCDIPALHENDTYWCPGCDNHVTITFPTA